MGCGGDEDCFHALLFHRGSKVKPFLYGELQPCCLSVEFVSVIGWFLSGMPGGHKDLLMVEMRSRKRSLGKMGFSRPLKYSLRTPATELMSWSFWSSTNGSSPEESNREEVPSVVNYAETPEHRLNMKTTLGYREDQGN